MPAAFVQKNVLHAPLGNDDRDDLLVDECGVGEFCADNAVSAVFVQTPPEWLHEVVCGVA